MGKVKRRKESDSSSENSDSSNDSSSDSSSSSEEEVRKSRNKKKKLKRQERESSNEPERYVLCIFVNKQINAMETVYFSKSLNFRSKLVAFCLLLHDSFNCSFLSLTFIAVIILLYV